MNSQVCSFPDNTVMIMEAFGNEAYYFTQDAFGNKHFGW